MRYEFSILALQNPKTTWRKGEGEGRRQSKPLHAYLEVSPTVLNGTCFQVSEHTVDHMLSPPRHLGCQLIFQEVSPSLVGRSQGPVGGRRLVIWNVGALGLEAVRVVHFPSRFCQPSSCLSPAAQQDGVPAPSRVYRFRCSSDPWIGEAGDCEPASVPGIKRMEPGVSLQSREPSFHSNWQSPVWLICILSIHGLPCGQNQAAHWGGEGGYQVPGRGGTRYQVMCW